MTILAILKIGAVFRIDHCACGLAATINHRRELSAVPPSDITTLRSNNYLMCSVRRDRAIITCGVWVNSARPRRRKRLSLIWGTILPPLAIGRIRDASCIGVTDACPSHDWRDRFVSMRRLANHSGAFSGKSIPVLDPIQMRAALVVALRAQRQRDFRRTDIRRYFDNAAEIQPSVTAVIMIVRRSIVKRPFSQKICLSM